jgi:two-component system NtrC family sensor kinase
MIRFLSSLRVRLLLLVLFAIIPLLGLMLYMAWEDRQYRTAAFATADQTLARTLLGLGVGIALAFGAAWIGSDLFILRRVKALLSTAQRLASGDQSARTRLEHGVGELSQLARTFDQMADALEQREAECSRAEEALRKSEERFRTLYEDTPMGIYRTTPDGRVLMANSALIQMLGYSSFEELASRNLEKESFETASARSRFKELIERDGQVRGLEDVWLRRDSSTIFVRENARAVRAEDGSVLFYEGTIEDITDRKQTEEQVKRLNENLERHARELAALNKAGQAMASTLYPEKVLKLMVGEIKSLLDVEGVSVLLRDPASDDLIFAAADPDADLVEKRLPVTAGIAGWVVRERQPAVVGDAQSDPRFYHQVDAMTGLTTRSMIAVPLMFKGAVWGVIEAVNKVGGTFAERDREMLEALASSAAIAIENARLYQTEREQFRRLRQSQAQLVQAEKMGALGRLVASIAHEINNPLQAMQNSLELAEDELRGNLRREKLAQYLDLARGEIERLATIVRRMRDFYRPARAGVQPTDVLAVLQSVLELTSKQLQHSSVTVEREWADDLPLIQANPDYLKQVFLNLVLNAADAMTMLSSEDRQGGILRVRVALDEMRRRDNRLVPAVRIEFSDTGEGIPEKIISHLFEPFVTTKENGTGMGLSISYGLIEAHNGQITATSRPGVGTTFTILLPVREA